MMRAVIAAAAVASVMALGTTAYADSAGCGLGAQLFEGQQGIAPQVLAVTTNGTSGNQTFGITSGTLGCKSDGVVTTAQADVFMDENLDKIARDAARGEGETLESLATLMGIEDGDKSHFYSATQRNFAVIFPSEGVTSEQVMAALSDVMAADPILSRYVEA